MLILRKPWDSQPQDPTPVDWQSPFALGLVDGYSTGGGVANRLINGARPTSANFSIAPRYNGLLLKGSGTASGLQLPAVPIAGANRLQVTSLVHITSQSGEMIFEQSAVADSNAGFYFYGLSSSVFRILVHNGTSASFYDATYTMPARPVVLTVRVDISANPFTMEVWVDGALAASGSGALAAGTFLANTLNVGCRNGSSLPSDGAFGDLFVHNKWMPNRLLADWHRSLWEIYEARRIPIPVAAAGAGNTIAVPAGSLTLTGFAPTVAASANQVVEVPAGTLTLAGQTPTVTSSDHQTISVPAGTLTLTANAPTVTASENQSISVPAGALTLTGFEPSVLNGAQQVVQVPLGTLTLTGQAPTIAVSANQVIAVPAGTLTLAGQTPTVVATNPQLISVPLGTLTLTGLTPTVSNVGVNNQISVPRGTLTMSGYTPIVRVSTDADVFLDRFAARSRITQSLRFDSRITTQVGLRSSLKD